MTKRFGFTLAEVLITLGIIGVVAAMTMPTLMNSTQGAQYKTALKKAVSSISQGITLNYALAEYDFSTALATDDTGSDADQARAVDAMLSSHMNVSVADSEDVDYGSVTLLTANTGYLVGDTSTAFAIGTTDSGVFTSSGTTGGTLTSGMKVLTFADGTMFIYNPDAESCSSSTIADAVTAKCTGYIDVNGTNGPNKIVGCASAVAKGTTCTVDTPSDIYPVVFYNQRIVPFTEAGKAVLYN